MPYFTSWDANVFLCLLKFLPEELVKGMIKMVKETHEGFVETETRAFQSNLYYGRCGEKHDILMNEFRLAWRWKSPEQRKEFIRRWIIKKNHSDLERLKYDCSPYGRLNRIDCDKDLPKNGRLHSSLGLWSLWDSWCYDEMDRKKDFDLLRIIKRNNTISQWYTDIHEGRYFLFFRENNIRKCIDESSLDVIDNYRMKVMRFNSISYYASYEQFGEDLLVLDGPGLGKSGPKIEHIDDLFLV